MFRRIILASAGLLAMLGLAVAGAPSASAAAPADGWVEVKPQDAHTLAGSVIRFTANNRYVSAEISNSGDDYGMLRARATAVGPWEQYTLLVSGSVWAIRSDANGRYVSAEISRTGADYGMLRARATEIGPWEQYALYYNSGTGAYTLQSLANDLYVSTELNYTGARYGLLRARATAVGSWEQFVLS
jgi:hypothetical protein